LRLLHRTLTIVCCFAAALLLAWKLLHSVNYGYEFWYSQLDIQEHIAKFAPQNRQKKMGFERTTKPERIELFRAIGVSVNNSGEGLRDLSYRAHPQADTQTLLTEPEAIHLQDVANLIDVLEPIGWAAIALLIVLVLITFFSRLSPPGVRTSLLTLFVIALIGAVVVAVIGPHGVFKKLHEAVFPDDHAWFFYYQDSLMTTLMKAPDIFFAIGATWALTAALIYLLITLGLDRLGRRLSRM